MQSQSITMEFLKIHAPELTTANIDESWYLFPQNIIVVFIKFIIKRPFYW